MKRVYLLVIGGLLLLPAEVRAPPHVDFMTRSTLLNIAKQIEDLERAVSSMDRRQRRQHRAVMDSLAAIRASLRP